MKNNFISFIIVVLFIATSGCTHKDKTDINSPTSNKTELDAYKQTPAPPNTTTKAGENSPVALKDMNVPQDLNKQGQSGEVKDVTKRMIIKIGTLNIEVEKFDETARQVTEITKKLNGFVSNSYSTLNANGKKQGTMVLKVPADKYDALVSEVSLLGKVMLQNINANDITEEYIDLDARLKTQKELEQRLLKLLTEKTARLTDVVEVEQKLASVRQIIESLDGRMRYLRSQSDFSTLTLSIYEPSLLITSSGGGFFYEINQGFKKGLEGFTEVLSGIITVIIALLPIAILILIVLYVIVKIIKRKKKVITT
jgi:primosomal protein N''